MYTVIKTFRLDSMSQSHNQNFILYKFTTTNFRNSSHIFNVFSNFITSEYHLKYIKLYFLQFLKHRMVLIFIIF